MANLPAVRTNNLPAVRTTAGRRQHCSSGAPYSEVSFARDRTPYTEVTYTRDRDTKPTISTALDGAGFGVACLVGATFLLWSNEGSAVTAMRGLMEAQDHLDAGTGGLVHLSGTLRGEMGALRDPEYGVETAAAWLSRTPEVYQWHEQVHTSTRKVPDPQGAPGDTLTETTKTYSYKREWAAKHVPSNNFKEPGRENPPWHEALYQAEHDAGTPFDAQRWRQEVSLDGLLLEPSLLSQLDEAGLPAPRGTPRAAEGRVYAPGCESYRGDTRRTGCVRVAWRHAPLGEVSLLAREFASEGVTSEGFTSEGFASEGRRLGPWQARDGGYELAMLLRGRHSASDMMARAAQADAAWKWGVRAAGSLLVWYGWSLVLGPASHLASLVPLLGGLVGGLLSLVALALAATHALLVIALAWLLHRPLFAATLLALAAASLFFALGVGGLHRAEGRRATPAKPLSPSAPGGGPTTGSAGSAASNAAESLRSLKEMLDGGLITQGDFDAKKKEILARF